MASNQFRGRQWLPAKHARIADQLEQKFAKRDSGLLVVFETREVTWPSTSSAVPFYVSRVALENDRPEPETPFEILEYFHEMNWDHFIWMPLHIVHGDEVTFTMQYAHELQHYRQRLDPEIIRTARVFLNTLRRNGWTPLLDFENKPDEFDAHRNAVLVFEEIHGTETLAKYITRESRNSKIIARFYSRLFELMDEWKRYSF